MIEVNSNALFLSTFGVKIDVKNERKRVSRMCENAYLSIKNPKASRALKQALDPGHRLLALLTRLHFTTSATFSLRSWGPPDQILDPHLNLVILSLEMSFLHALKNLQTLFLQAHTIGTIDLCAVSKCEIRSRWEKEDCVSRFGTSLGEFISNDTAKTEFAILTMLYCEEVMKTSMGTLTSD